MNHLVLAVYFTYSLSFQQRSLNILTGLNVLTSFCFIVKYKQVIVSLVKVVIIAFCLFLVASCSSNISRTLMCVY